MLRKTGKRTLEIVAIALILFGICALCQPWAFPLYLLARTRHLARQRTTAGT